MDADRKNKFLLIKLNVLLRLCRHGAILPTLQLEYWSCLQFYQNSPLQKPRHWCKSSSSSINDATASTACCNQNYYAGSLRSSYGIYIWDPPRLLNYKLLNAEDLKLIVEIILISWRQKLHKGLTPQTRYKYSHCAIMTYQDIHNLRSMYADSVLIVVL